MASRHRQKRRPVVYVWPSSSEVESSSLADSLTVVCTQKKQDGLSQDGDRGKQQYVFVN